MQAGQMFKHIIFYFLVCSDMSIASDFANVIQKFSLSNNRSKTIFGIYNQTKVDLKSDPQI
jgi:hypothetical protein